MITIKQPGLHGTTSGCITAELFIYIVYPSKDLQSIKSRVTLVVIYPLARTGKTWQLCFYISRIQQLHLIEKDIFYAYCPRGGGQISAALKNGDRRSLTRAKLRKFLGY